MLETKLICEHKQFYINGQKGLKYSGVKSYGDYRELIANKDVDAVMVSTPDHWHASIMIHAAEAGKDVYVEKPVGNSIEECRQMVKAQERYKRVVQAGQWQRSQQHFKDAVDFVLNEMKKDYKYNIESSNVKNIAKKLAEEAINKGSTDNISVMILFFN